MSLKRVLDNIDKREEKKLRIIFSYHAPKGDDWKRYQDIRAGAFDFSKLISDTCPPSIERETAINRIQEAMFWANASIARDDERTDYDPE